MATKSLFTKVQIAGTENLVPVIHKVCGRGGRVDYVERAEDPANRSIAIPARQEIQLDYAKIAELQAWRTELLAKFGK